MPAGRVPLIGCALGLLLTAAVSGRQVSAGRAQSPSDQFARGLTALHHFEYEEANTAFVQARETDPRFAMAYWGEAMTYSQLLWRNENVDAGRAALARLGATPAARAAAAGVPRDRALIAAAEALFGDGDVQTRHQRYQDAMGAAAREFPRDPDVVSLYALSRLASASRGLIGSPGNSDARAEGLAGSELQREIAGLLQGVLAAHPKHPGALHYLLHTYDDPAHASLALDAARTYSTIAGGASHALHMPAHIFLQLGRWNDAATSDRAAYRASSDWVRRRALPAALRNYHALSWLQYELLQLGRYREARETIDEIAPVASEVASNAHGGAHQPLLSDLSSMRARYVVETADWAFIAGTTTFGNVNDLFAIGMSAALIGGAAGIDVARRVQQELAVRSRAPEQGDLRPAIAIMEREAAALLAAARGGRSEALDVLRGAARDEAALPAPFGLPIPIKPAPELLGEMLLQAGRAQEAAAAFEAVLKRYPNRSLALLGRARAAAKAGDAAEARRYYAELEKNYAHADPAVPRK